MIISECCVQLHITVNLVKLCRALLSGAQCSKQRPSKGLSTPHHSECDRKTEKDPSNNVAKQSGAKPVYRPAAPYSGVQFGIHAFLTKREVTMAEYWPSSYFCILVDRDG